MNNINDISPQDNKYLKVLCSIAKPPEKLYYIGSLPQERVTTVAIVGSRRPTAYGKEVTALIASNLARHGIAIVSGLALGVDGIAHQSALQAGGLTIAILGNGLPQIYPASHRGLAANIIQNHGAIITEYEPHTAPRGYQFLERNRLVSGLADAIVITEASSRSGTLNTAAHALEQGKDVFVVPGNITSPLSQGCNNLLKQGALPITSPDDILAVIAPQSHSENATLPLGATPLESDIIALIQKGLRDGEKMQRHLNVTASDFNIALTMLEVNGVIRSLGANQWTLS